MASAATINGGGDESAVAQQNIVKKDLTEHDITGEKERQTVPEEQATKRVLETGVKGTVKWYNVRAHYGFIARDDGNGKDVFVHQTAISKSRMIKSYLRTLGNDEEVLFDIVEGRQGPEAANVTGPDGVEVRGSYLEQIRYFGYRRQFPFHGQWQGRRYYQYSGREPGGGKFGRSEGIQGEQKQPRNEDARRFRNFRARRQQTGEKKPEDNEVADEQTREDRTGSSSDSRRRKNHRSSRRSQAASSDKGGSPEVEKVNDEDENPPSESKETAEMQETEKVEEEIGAAPEDEQKQKEEEVIVGGVNISS